MRGWTLRVEAVRAPVHQQDFLSGGLRDPHAFTETLARVAALVGALWARWRQPPDQVWRRLHRLLLRKLAASGLPASAHQSPRALAQALGQAFGDAAQPMCDWLLRLERARYQAGASTGALSALEREFKRLAWSTLLAPKPR